jgi:glycosyltransferase involved in cell wall biosynthesis
MSELVSILLPTRTRVRQLQKAVESLQKQTWRNIEILILDDGSTDGTPGLLGRLAQSDTRIRLFHQESSRGLAAALNRLIEESRGEWVARMDDDDCSHPQRIERQLAYMQAHQLDVAGTWYKRISRFGHSVIRPPIHHEHIAAELLFQPPLLHPSVMIRKEVIKQYGGYREHIDHAEDFDFWIRLVPHCRFGNVPEVLFDYTLSSQQVSRRFNNVQVQSAQALRASYLQSLDILTTPLQLATHIHLRDPLPIEHLDELEAAGVWLRRLGARFSPEVETVFARQWFLIGVRAAGLGPAGWRSWQCAELSDSVSPRQRALLKILFHCRLRYRSPLYRLLEPLAGS